MKCIIAGIGLVIVSIVGSLFVSRGRVMVINDRVFGGSYFIGQPDWSPEYVLPKATYVEFIDPSRGVGYSFSLKQTRPEDRPVLDSLKRMRYRGTEPPTRKPDLLLTNIEAKGIYTRWKEGTKATYPYVSQTGEVSRDGDWYVVPDEFRLWTLRQMEAKRELWRRLLHSVPAAQLVKRADNRRYLIISDSLNPGMSGLPKDVTSCTMWWWSPGQDRKRHFTRTAVTETHVLTFPAKGDQNIYHFQFQWNRNHTPGPVSKVYTFTLPDR